MRSYADILGGALVAVLTWLLIELGWTGAVLLPLGLLFVAALPGLFLVEVLFPRGGPVWHDGLPANGPSPFDRILMAVGLSLILSLVTAFGVAQVRGRLDTVEVVRALAGLVLALAAASALRRRRRPASVPPSTPLHRRRGVQLAAALLVALLVVWGATAIHFRSDPGRVEFYVQNAAGQAFQDADAVAPGENQSIVLGVLSNARNGSTFVIVIQAHTRNDTVVVWTSAELAPIRGQVLLVPASFHVPADAYLAQISLHGAGDPEAERGSRLLIRYAPAP